MKIQCDVVVPIYNGLTYVRSCIESILQWSGSIAYRLILVDDGSDAFTRQYLQSLLNDYSHVVLHHNQRNIGFVKSCNRGIELGDGAYVVLVNSDVVVTPNWLQRLLSCAESDSRIGSVNPLTNHASQINIAMAPGANFLGMDQVVYDRAKRSFPDVVTGVGFCLLLRRAALEQVGVFDEIYGRGYCEESDLCMRLTTSGWRTVVADHVYVYHKGGGTFQDRAERYTHNRKIFDARWKAEYQRQWQAFRKENPLAPVKALFSTPQRWEPMPVVWQTARKMLQAGRQKHWLGVGKEALRGGINTLRNWRAVGTPATVAKITRPQKLRITYVLRDVVVAGGVLSVIQLVNELILLGVEARIVATFEDAAIYNWTCLYTQPIIFRSPKELIAQFPETDIAVATLWITASWVAKVQQRGRAKQTAYFIQDYEAWFFPEKKVRSRAKVKNSYSLIAHRIVKSDWLQKMLRHDGVAAHKILLGMNLDRFYPRDIKSTRPTIMAMARPKTARRGFKPTIKALALVKDAFPTSEIVLFGSRGLAAEDIPFVFTDAGVVTNHDELAQRYSQADIFLDGSDFQGFGRCGLEAMACGVACVLTGVGGVTEYARDGRNALVVPPNAPNAFAEAIIRLLDDHDLKQRLIVGGRETVAAYCHKREAKETLHYFLDILPET